MSRGADKQCRRCGGSPAEAPRRRLPDPRARPARIGEQLTRDAGPGFGRDAGLVALARDAVVSEVEDEVPADPVPMSSIEYVRSL